MNFQLNKNLGNWLTQLNGKTVGKIFQVDYNRIDRHEDSYLPWLFFIIFTDFDKFLEIEGDFDGDHIKINLYDNSELDKKLKENNLADQPDLWRVYDTEKQEKLGRLLEQKIEFIEYGIDKDEFEIDGTKIKGQKDVFDFIAFNCESLKLTIFESSGLGVSDDSEVKLMFEDSFDRYETK
jgi:hypothetical protein